MYKYEATNVEHIVEDEAITIAFGGLPDADMRPTVYLILQRSTNEDEDDHGVEGVYVEWCAQGMSCYGCINSFHLYPKSIRVTFNEDADFYLPDNLKEANDDQKLTKLVVSFTAEDKYQDLKEKLSFIFRDCDCYFVHDSEQTIK